MGCAHPTFVLWKEFVFEVVEWLHFVDVIVMLVQLLENQINHLNLSRLKFNMP